MCCVCSVHSGVKKKTFTKILVSSQSINDLFEYCIQNSVHFNITQQIIKRFKTFHKLSLKVIATQEWNRSQSTSHYILKFKFLFTYELVIILSQIHITITIVGIIGNKYLMSFNL